MYGVDTNAETLEKAEKMGIIRKGCKEGKAFFPEADLIILAIYPKDSARLWSKTRRCSKKGAL